MSHTTFAVFCRADHLAGINLPLFILFLICLNIYVSSIYHAFMNLHIYLYTSKSFCFPLHFILKPGGYYYKNYGLHLSPTIFTSKSMGGILPSNLSISHSSTFPTYTQISCQDFHHLFLRYFHMDFLSQIAYSSTQWMGMLVVCFVVGSYPVRREPFIRYLDKTLLF